MTVITKSKTGFNLFAVRAYVLVEPRYSQQVCAIREKQISSLSSHVLTTDKPAYLTTARHIYTCVGNIRVTAERTWV